MLAEATTTLPDPNHFSSLGWVIVILAAIAVGANQISDFFDRRSGVNKQRDVNIIDDGVSRAEFLAAETENKKIHDQIFAVASGKERGLREEMNKAIQELRGSLSDTSNTMHELKGEMKQLSIQLVNVQQDLQNR
ncbi:MAG: hypothetical protein HC901_00280 [Bdellovibrionaceae bacterium]|nr:hypothetical protein [Pseudobdellovibrionaceae bacterium]